jgi:hypothetical protein
MNLLPKIVVTPVNVYEQMAQGPEERRALLEASVRDPIGYKLRLVREMVEDPQGVVDAYLAMTGGVDEKINAMISDRMKIAREANLHLSLPLATLGFDNRLLEIIRSITPQSIEKMAKAYHSLLMLVRPNPNNPPAVWKAKVYEDITSSGDKLMDGWSQEVFVLGTCKNSEDVVKWLLLGRVIERIQASPIRDAASDAFDLQNARISYLKTVLLTAALHIHVLSD